MAVQNLPIQVIAHCDAEGTMRPLRFRYEDAQHQLHTVHVDQVTDTRQTEYVGIPVICCLCKARENGREHLYELRYTVMTHKWILFQRVY